MARSNPKNENPNFTARCRSNPHARRKPNTSQRMIKKRILFFNIPSQTEKKGVSPETSLSPKRVGVWTSSSRNADIPLPKDLSAPLLLQMVWPKFTASVSTSSVHQSVKVSYNTKLLCRERNETFFQRLLFSSFTITQTHLTNGMVVVGHAKFTRTTTTKPTQP